MILKKLSGARGGPGPKVPLNPVVEKELFPNEENIQATAKHGRGQESNMAGKGEGPEFRDQTSNETRGPHRRQT